MPGTSGLATQPAFVAPIQIEAITARAERLFNRPFSMSVSRRYVAQVPKIVDDETGASSPGRLVWHYAERTELIDLWREGDVIVRRSRTVWPASTASQDMQIRYTAPDIDLQFGSRFKTGTPQVGNAELIVQKWPPRIETITIARDEDAFLFPFVQAHAFENTARSWFEDATSAEEGRLVTPRGRGQLSWEFDASTGMLTCVQPLANGEGRRPEGGIRVAYRWGSVPAEMPETVAVFCTLDEQGEFYEVADETMTLVSFSWLDEGTNLRAQFRRWLDEWAELSLWGDSPIPISVGEGYRSRDVSLTTTKAQLLQRVDEFVRNGDVMWVLPAEKYISPASTPSRIGNAPLEGAGSLPIDKGVASSDALDEEMMRKRAYMAGRDEAAKRAGRLPSGS